MTMYRLRSGVAQAERIDTFEFASEGNHEFSPQRILADNPDLIFGLPELELVNSDALIAFREYTTTRGSIDLLLIGSNGEIIIVETKLLRNPESTRQVVAQIIDYIKAFSAEAVDDIIRKIRGRCPSGAEKLCNDVNFAALVQENIKTGNYKVIVAGDSIHPNVLGMIESIHSAPHLAFTIFLVDLHTCRSGADEIIIKPSIVASTVEIERSVLRIEIEPTSSKYQIDAQSPEPQGKGTRPILSWDQYISNLNDLGFRKVIENFRQRWINEIADSINMGQVGFSAGLEYGGRRLAIQFVYDNRVPIISEKARKYSEIPNEIFEDYLNDLKQSPLLHDKFLASGKVEVPFSAISEDILSLILDSAIKLAKRYKSIAE